MRLSVIIPAYNAQKYIEEAVSSVDCVDVEIIVVDDGSTDSTAEIASSLGCKLLRQANSGQAVARNNGAKIATGDALIFLDADDIFYPGAVEKLKEYYTEDSIIRGAAVEFFSPDLPEYEKVKLSLKKGSYFGLIAGCLIPRNVFNELGGFDINTKAGESIEFTLKAKDHGVMIRDCEVNVIKRRVHSDNFGRKYRSEEFENYLSILKARLRRNAR